jgi:DNA-binding NtrC family response regulator
MVKEMIDTNALRGAIAAKGLTQQTVAQHLGMSPKTFYSKMKRGVFGSDEMEMMIKLLSIENPTAIFFAEKVT